MSHQWNLDADTGTFQCADCSYQVKANANVRGTIHMPLDKTILIGKESITLTDVEEAILAWALKCIR